LTTITPVKIEATSSQTYEYLVYYFFGALDTLLGFRFVLKLLGANSGSYFVNFVYNLSKIFVLPFEGIFKKVSSGGTGTSMIIEPATIIALIVYGFLAIGIVKLIRISSGEEQTGGDNI